MYVPIDYRLIEAWMKKDKCVIRRLKILARRKRIKNINKLK